MTDYKSTINLPVTGFPMKADLAKREPEMLAAWERDDVYGKIRKVAKGRPTFILTDGPPYANGALQLGHSLTRRLRFRLRSGARLWRDRFRRAERHSHRGLHARLVHDPFGATGRVRGLEYRSRL